MCDNVMQCMHQRDKLLICNESTVSSLRKFVILITDFLHNLSPLIEAYVLDFFVENHWTKIPVTWQSVFSKLELQEIGIFLNSKEVVKYKEVWPLSLLAFRKTVFTLTLPRDAVSSPEVVLKFLKEISGLSNVNNVNNCIWKCPEEEFKNLSGHHKSIKEICRRHVKPKKQHEIARFAQLAELVFRSCSINHVIDIGAGQGHLSRLLSFQHHLKVATVESQQSHIKGALQFDKQAFSILEKKSKRQTDTANGTIVEQFSNLPKHFEGFVAPTTSKGFLQNIVRSTWENAEEIKEVNFGLLGLHTCGDLSATLLKLFVECPEAHALIYVGCCYMKLNADKEHICYPLSNCLHELPHHHLSYEAREVACHALEGYVLRLKENPELLKIHCYRAALEKIIVKYYPYKRHTGLKSVKFTKNLSFKEYVNKALKNSTIVLPDEEVTLQAVAADLSEWKKVVIIYSLRLLMAPVIEHLILLDRMLFLFEKGYTSCLLPVFDPLLSPRNHVLLSVKNKANTQ